MKKDTKVEISRGARRTRSEHGYETLRIARSAGQVKADVNVLRYFFRATENPYFEAMHCVMADLRDHLRGLDCASFAPVATFGRCQ